MNILQIVSSLEEISGPANSLYLVSSGIAKRGHKVTCAHYMGGDGPLVAKLRLQGIEVVNLNPKKRPISRLGRLNILFRLIMLVYKNNIDTIHAHTWDADCFAFLAGFAKKMEKIVTLHSRSYFDWLNLHRTKYDKFIPMCKAFVCVSNVMAEEFKRKFNIPDERIAVIYNAPLEKFSTHQDGASRKKIRAEFKINDNDFLLGSIGNFTQLKGIIYLLRALNEVNADNFKLLLVGADAQDMKKEYDAYLKDKPLKLKVIFAGFRQDVCEILDGLDLFVFPSIEEADPIALSEAMARGKPVIATRIGGIPEKITDKQNGILVDAKDIEQLKKAIGFSIQNQAELSKLGQNARNTINDKFSYSKMINAYEELYRR